MKKQQVKKVYSIRVKTGMKAGFLGEIKDLYQDQG